MSFAAWIDDIDQEVVLPSPRALVVDVENTVFFRPDKTKDISPYHPSNRLVSVGWGWVEDDVYTHGGYRYFYHRELEAGAPVTVWQSEIQAALDAADIIVAHNAKHDLSWLLESGFTVECPVWDTMVAEYLLLRGQKSRQISLAAVSAHYGVHLKQGELISELWDSGVQFDAMPMATVTEYGMSDIQSCGEIYVKQRKLYEMEENRGLIPIRDMSMEFTRVLTDIERNGNKIDMTALAEVEAELLKEQETLSRRCQEIVFQVMGDRPVNLASPEQLSWVIYSRKVNDKKLWAETFNLGTNADGKALRRPRMAPAEFSTHVRKGTTQLRRQKASQCPECGGKGYIQLRRKDGSPRKNMNVCHPCKKTGLIYTDLAAFAGFKMSPRDIDDVAVGGFSTDKETLQRHAFTAEERGDPLGQEFFTNLVRLNAVDAYLSNFVGGINRAVQSDGILHPKLNQCITATARLSSTEPNFQNLPAGRTLRLRRAIVSRWADEGGEILEGDYAGLEFVVAGELSNDPVIAEMKRLGIDAHKKTAVICFRVKYEDVTKDQRQKSKVYSFQPLYGGTGADLPSHIQEYFRQFPVMYPGVGAWHKVLQDEAIRYKRITLPDGRQFDFPKARRLGSGRSVDATKIVNYPVQSTATGTIVPLAVIRLWKAFRKHQLKSLIINTVHDSVVVDRHPGDNRELVIRLIHEAFAGVKPELQERFGWHFKLPLDVEIEAGPNWLDKSVVEVTADFALH